MLARLGGVDGVERSYVNRAGTLLRLAVAPGADPDAVAASATQALGDEAGGLTAERLPGPAAAAALAGEEWRDRGRVAELSALEWRSRALPPLLALGTAMLALGLGLWLWRRRRRSP